MKVFLQIMDIPTSQFIVLLHACLVFISRAVSSDSETSNYVTLVNKNVHWSNLQRTTTNNDTSDLLSIDVPSLNRTQFVHRTFQSDENLAPNGGKNRRLLKRQIYGNDDRTEVVGSSSAREPLVSSVKLWSDKVQCSGTLIGPCHVITAAHCIHNGQKYVSALSAILVGISTSASDDDLNYFTIERHYLPPEWIAGKGFKHDHDYALLKLTEPTHVPYMDTKPLTLKPKTQIKMASFPYDKKYGTKWITRCKIGGKFGKFMFKHFCDAVFGSSGAGLFVTPRIAHAQKPVLVGVLASWWTQLKGTLRDIRLGILYRVTSANTAVRITHDVQHRIDKFINSSYQC